MKGETKQSGTFINLKNQTKNVFIKFKFIFVLRKFANNVISLMRSGQECRY